MEWETWFRDKSFTADWTSHYIPNWVKFLAGLRDRDVAALEIGAWEGRSTIFFLEYLPRCRITCIDTFAGSPEHIRFGETALASLEARFDSNLAPYGDRVRKIKSRSLPALDQLAQETKTFDLIYIDGSHVADDVLIDTAAAWRLLAPNGICIWDDYLWPWTAPHAPHLRQTIDAFLDLHANELAVLHIGEQVIIERRPIERPPDAAGDEFVTFPRTAANLMRFLTRQPLRPLAAAQGHGRRDVQPLKTD